LHYRGKARFRLAAAAAGAAVAIAGALPAQAAAAPGWRVMHQYSPRGFYSQYSAVAAAGSHAWAAGGYGVAGYGSPAGAYWNGSRWSRTAFPAKTIGEVTAISADSPADAWAVTPGDVLHWQRGRWSIARTWNLDAGPPGPVKWSVLAFGPADVWVFGPSGGPSGGVWHLHGRTWTHVTGAGRSILSASAVSASDMWAIGWQHGTLLHYIRGAWHAVTAPRLKGHWLGAIYANSPTSVWITATASGASGLELLHLDGNRWTTDNLPWALPVSAVNTNSVPPNALSPDAAGGMWLTSYSPGRYAGWLLHLSASGQWSKTSIGGWIMRGIVRAPGRRGMWAVGSTPQGSGPYPFSDAVIWAYGSVR
jgi:hypothetical protein